MSTRAVYTFKDRYDTYHVYKHHDGYPSGAALWIEGGFQQFNDDFDGEPKQFEASELATRFIVANKGRYGGIYLSKGHTYHGDLEYRYEIESDSSGAIIRAYKIPFESNVPEQIIFRGTLKEFLEWSGSKDLRTSFSELKERINNSKVSSFWLKQAFVELDNRDVLDAINDLSYLLDVFKVKWEEAKND